MFSIKCDFFQRIDVLPRLLLQKGDGSDDLETRRDSLLTVIIDIIHIIHQTVYINYLQFLINYILQCRFILPIKIWILQLIFF